jgi:hypothetical protein
LRKRFLRALALAFVPFIGALLIRLIYLTSRKHFDMPQAIPQEPVIFACWHGNLLLQPFLYYQFRKIPKAKVLISEHFDGQLIAGVIDFFGLGTIHGSTTRGGAKVLIQGLKSLSDGFDIGITPDGPKGPRYTVSDGVVVMAQKRQAKVIVYSCVPSSFWQLGSWDRFVIPKPFCTLNFYASEPLDLDGMEMDMAKEYLHKALMLHTTE